jgi:hypothetical protein
MTYKVLISNHEIYVFEADKFEVDGSGRVNFIKNDAVSAVVSAHCWMWVKPDVEA